MNPILDTLNDRQLEAVQLTEGPLLITARRVGEDEGTDLPHCLSAGEGRVALCHPGDYLYQ